MFQILREVRALTAGASEVDPVDTVRINRLWKVFTEDEGVHSLCQYLTENPEIEVLDLLDNKITYLGCNYLGKMFKNSTLQLNISKVLATFEPKA